MNIPECFRGWDGSIKSSQIEIKDILKQSPSLGNYFLDIAEECYVNTSAIVRAEYDIFISNQCPFSIKPETLL